MHPGAVLVAQLPQARDVRCEATAAGVGRRLAPDCSACSGQDGRVDLAETHGDDARLPVLAVLPQTVLESVQVKGEVTLSEVDDIAPADASDGRSLDELLAKGEHRSCQLSTDP